MNRVREMSTAALRLAALALAVPAALLTACGPSGGQSGPTPTPLSEAGLRSAYQAAANAYNAAELPVAQAENAYCDPSSSQADLARCEVALNQDREATLSFDNAVRGLSFAAAARPDVTKLLGDDAQLETILGQAATAPSLSVISSLTGQISRLLTTTSQDADQVRGDIGLPSGTPSPRPSA